MTPRQSRMARAALGWKIAKLAQQAGVDPHMVSRFEHGQRTHLHYLLEEALARAGVAFLDHDERGEGVLVKR